ncbi:Rrf2 family transcriptional regulator [Clostridium sp. P21]|uniref:Rrf2 family transcriptional regulator n=1 Tax=Clostridium muellerianum TaxID=2716538 RepID=A0A7Y0ELD6_9CLOT|nr:Rrf2 family transcriptional regulator [Clostridium muellerianum]
MKLSTKGQYGVKAMVDLAIHYGEGPSSIKNIAERQNISEYYLEQLFSPLRKANLIKSIRGAQGGYVLEREPKDITVFEIMEVLEGPVEISKCIDENNDNSCGNMDCCATRLLWSRIKESIDGVMKSTTLEDMVEDYKKMKSTKMKGDNINE